LSNREIRQHPDFEDLDVLDAAGVNLLEWDVMLDEVLDMA